MANTLYTKALVIGATSGIGLSLANRLVSHGVYVIATGRRQAQLDAFVSQHGTDKAAAYRLDILDLAALPSFASTVLSAHPDLDCIIINAGIQRPFDFTKPDTVNFSHIQDELATNYTAPVHLSMAFLSHLQSLSETTHKTTHLIYVSANLGLVPTMLRTANYNASKAALHHWIMAFRAQLNKSQPADTPGVKVTEIFPPAVQTELHDERHQPDLKNGREIGMPLEAFTDGVIEGLRSRDDVFAVGAQGQALLDGFERQRQEVFVQGVEQVEGILEKFMR